ncbi:hypothetical protein F2Q69_00005676 [Brassica cretica]|uniref:Uncharacterized protein n=1 Tax=Brassica cretica TaxID=69181 RepID=A0A8S9PH33_BRACR|nr:hypothetical protein F2Q69_00005676 [Brassica cretica]
MRPIAGRMLREQNEQQPATCDQSQVAGRSQIAGRAIESIIDSFYSDKGEVEVVKDINTRSHLEASAAGKESFFASEGRKELKFTGLVGRRKVRVKFWVEVSWPELLRSEYDYIHVHATMSTISAIHDHNMVRAFKLGSYHFREVKMEISMQENNLEIRFMGLMSIVLQMIIGMKVVKKFVDSPVFEIGFVKVDT